jgi:hypothetical protein
MPSSPRDALLAEYVEVSSNFRMLTDIRFKLLAFLPVAAGVAAGLVARGNATALTLVFSLFGLVVTIGLVTYNERNDQLYDTLVARAAAIERSLGIPDGTFANRPRAWLELARGRWKVDHRTGVSTIYKASIALWLFGALRAAIYMAEHALSKLIAPNWVNLIALAVAVALTILGAWLVKREREHTSNRLRKTAAQAVSLAKQLDVTALIDSPNFVSRCQELAGKKADVHARARFLSQLPRDDIAHYVADGSPEWTAAQTVAVITDLAPEWLYDCATSRRIAVDAADPHLAAAQSESPTSARSTTRR